MVKPKKSKESADKGPGTLHVVATPIGNLEDITLRALRILDQVDLIASEDTRHTKKLLSRYDIRTPLLSYYKGKEVERAETILELLDQGDDVALVSDAGTPGISDPGAILVKMARANGFRVVPVPGPSALAAALSISGLTEAAYHFAGFLPAKQNQRKKYLEALVFYPAAIIFYESPHRILKTLADCRKILGDRQALIARELTKIHEEVLHGPLSEVHGVLAARPSIKGEFVVILAGAENEGKPEGKDLPQLLVWYKNQAGLSLSEAVKRIAADLGLNRSEVYKEALKVWEELEPG